MLEPENWKAALRLWLGIERYFRVAVQGSGCCFYGLIYSFLFAPSADAFDQFQQLAWVHRREPMTLPVFAFSPSTDFRRRACAAAFLPPLLCSRLWLLYLSGLRIRFLGNGQLILAARIRDEGTGGRIRLNIRPF